MMRWRRDQRNAGNRVTCLGNHLVNLETRKLSALTGLRSLSHLDLYFFGIDQILRGHTETTRGNLLGLARQ